LQECVGWENMLCVGWENMLRGKLSEELASGRS